jgi:hypothetical protein
MRITTTVLTALILAVAAPSAGAATTRACKPVVNPYPNTRYAGVDLSHIRATGVSCTTARSVARGAHRKALGMTPSLSGIRRFTWNGWRVTGDLRPASDRYVATRGSRRVTWRF